MEDFHFRAQRFKLFYVAAARLERGAYPVDYYFNFRAVVFGSSQRGQKSVKHALARCLYALEKPRKILAAVAEVLGAVVARAAYPATVVGRAFQSPTGLYVRYGKRAVFAPVKLGQRVNKRARNGQRGYEEYERAV